MRKAGAQVLRRGMQAWKNKGTKRSGRVHEQGGGNVSVEDRTSKRWNKVKRKEERRGQTAHLVIRN